MRGKKYYIVAIILTVIVLLGLPVIPSVRVKNVVRENVTPFQAAVALFSSEFSETTSFFFDARNALRERERLMGEVANLRSEVDGLKTLERENAVLREQLDFKARQSHRLVLSEVIARGDSSGWWQTLTLNRGRQSGVAPGMPVMTSEGLIGRTMAVTDQSAEVLLLTDPACRIACRIGRTGACGILRGRGVSVENKMKLALFLPVEPCRIDYLAKDQSIIGGDEVYTSGLGGIFPEGLLVGHVLESSLDDSMLYQSADIKPAAKLDALRYVFVVVTRTVSALPDAEPSGANGEGAGE